MEQKKFESNQQGNNIQNEPLTSPTLESSSYKLQNLLDVGFSVSEATRLYRLRMSRCVANSNTDNTIASVNNASHNQPINMESKLELFIKDDVKPPVSKPQSHLLTPKHIRVGTTIS